MINDNSAFSRMQKQLDEIARPAHSMFKEFARQEEERREMLQRALSPMREFQDSLKHSAIFDFAEQARLAVETSSFAKEVAEIQDSSVTFRDLIDAKALDPMREYIEAYENSALGGMQEQIRLATDNSGIAKIMADLDASKAGIQDQLDRLKFDIPEFSGLGIAEEAARRALDAFNVPEIPDFGERYELPLPIFDHAAFIPPPMPEPEPGEAAQVLAALQEDFEALKTEHAFNPSKGVFMIATLSNGVQLNISAARNIGDQTIEIVGVCLETTRERKVMAGVGTVSFEVLVVDLGPQEPNLQVIHNDPEEGE